MNYRDQKFLAEAYLSIYKKDVYNDKKIIEELVQELMEEGFFGDLKDKAKTVFNKAKETASNIASKLSSKLAETIVGKILGILSQDQKEEFANLLAGSAKNKIPNEVKQAAQQISTTEGGDQQQNESYLSSKQLIIEWVFTENNLKEAIRSSGFILNEAKNPSVLDDVANYAITKLRAKYKTDKALQNALSKLPKHVSKILTSSGKKVGKVAQQNNATQEQEQNNTAQQGGQQGQQTPPATQTVTLQQTQQAAQNIQSGQSEQSGQSVIKKIYEFIKSHPKISAGVALGLIGVVIAAFSGSAPVVAPFIIKSLSGAAMGGGTNVLKQAFTNAGFKNINWAEAGKSAAIGGALGGLMSVISTGLGNIAQSVSGLFSGHGGGHGGHGGHGNIDIDSLTDDQIRKMNFSNRGDLYHREIMQAAGVKEAEFRMGVPYDTNGRRLLDDATVDKIANKWHYPAATPSFIKAHQEVN
jgi:hypothetical protein